eukprot:jgi/Mesvir1/17578/Mv08813-RA.1
MWVCETDCYCGCCETVLQEFADGNLLSPGPPRIGILPAVDLEKDTVTIRDLQDGTTEVCISSPDAVGLGCDFSRVLFDFGLNVVSGDFTTDGKWSFVVYKVRPAKGMANISWRLLKQRLAAVCPNPAKSLGGYGEEEPLVKPRDPLFMFQVCAQDRCGILNDVTMLLWEIEMTIHKIHISTSPDNRAVDLFFVTDDRKELPKASRQEDACRTVMEYLNDPGAFCSFSASPVDFVEYYQFRAPEVTAGSDDKAENLLKANMQSPGGGVNGSIGGGLSPGGQVAIGGRLVPEDGGVGNGHGYAARNGSSSLRSWSEDSWGSDEMLGPEDEPSHSFPRFSQGLSPPASPFDELDTFDMSQPSLASLARSRSANHHSGQHGAAGHAPNGRVANAIVWVDNQTSRQHTVLHVHARDRKGLLYDVLRSLKDVNLAVRYGRINTVSAPKGSGVGDFCELSIFLQQVDGTILSDKALIAELCRRMKAAMEAPLSISISNKGMGDVCTELVVTTPLDRGGGVRPRILYDTTAALRELNVQVFKADIVHGTLDRRVEVHRFLLTDANGNPIMSAQERGRISKRVKAFLMG